MARPPPLSALEQTKRDAGAGYLAGAFTEFVLYPIGSYKTQQQSGMKSDRCVRGPLAPFADGSPWLLPASHALAIVSALRPATALPTAAVISRPLHDIAHDRRRLMIRGMFSLPLLGIAPSLATFFAVYTPLKNYAGDSAVGVLAASVAAAVPASAVRIPADVLQKRVVIGVDKSVLVAATVRAEGLPGAPCLHRPSDGTAS